MRNTETQERLSNPEGQDKEGKREQTGKKERQRTEAEQTPPPGDTGT